MNYLSRVSLIPGIAEQSQLALMLMDNRYGMHRLLWDLFPGHDGQVRPFLFREEREQSSQGRQLPLFYVVSSVPPLTESALFQIETRPYAPDLAAGDQLAFRLRANPVISRKQPGRKNSASHDVVMDAQHQCLGQLCQQAGISSGGAKRERIQRLQKLPAEQLLPLLAQASPTAPVTKLPALLQQVQAQALHRWLAVRGEDRGFQLSDQCGLECTGYQWNTLAEKSRKAGFASVDYEGVLTVTDPDRFTPMLVNGLGKARAFGCGLMMVRRI